MPPVDVVTEITIARPRQQVATYAANPDNAPWWYAKIQSAEWLTPAPLAKGSRIAFVANFLKRRLEYTYEIVEYDPGHLLVMRTAQGPFPMETTYTWNDEGPDATRMTLRNRGNPSGFSALTAPLLAKAIVRANRKDLQLLKAILEQPNPSVTTT